MLTAQFREFQNKLYNSKCPEDFFGVLPDNYEISKAKIDEIQNDALRSIVFEVKADSHEGYQVQQFKYKLCKLSDWAIRKVKKGIYGNHLHYKVKLRFEVASYDEENFFYLESNDRKLYFNHLDAVYFEGYDHPVDKIYITKTDGSVVNGHVEYNGTHGAREYFYLNNEHIGSLSPNKLELGDIIEIETTRFDSEFKFLEFIIQINSHTTVITKKH